MNANETTARYLPDGAWQVDLSVELMEDILTAAGFDRVPEATDDAWVDAEGNILSIGEALPVALKTISEALQ
jgi:hypothetical protein